MSQHIQTLIWTPCTWGIICNCHATPDWMIYVSNSVNWIQNMQLEHELSNLDGMVQDA